ncbi:MAG: DUF3788 domain-containing protein [Lachnospiraceae bacterium]
MRQILLWNNLCQYMETQYQSKPIFEYSGCSVPGWNVKYKKSGRSLCTLYPMDGYFVALVVIGEREKNEFDLTLPTLTVYTQKLFESSKDKNGLCWLMFEARDEAVLSDIKHCISIRRGSKKQKS